MSSALRIAAACLLTMLALGIPVSVVAAQGESSPLGGRLDDFALQDHRGHEHTLADFSDQPVLVLAFLGTECPLAKLYGPRLVRLAAEYRPRGVALIGVMSNSQDSITRIAAYARQQEISFPLVKDVGNRLADRLGAQRTPEVFVLDRERVVRYAGRIDDQYDVGIIRDAASREDLRIAIEELLAGKPVSTPRSEAVGCHIGRMRTPQAGASVTYSQQIARILQRRCVECHREDDIAPFALTDYDQVSGWAEMIAEVVREDRMPPWHADPQYGHFANDRHMPEEEKQLIYRWLSEGTAEGDPAEQLEPLPHTPSWQLPREPDLVLPMTDKPFGVPAEGEVRYQYFRVDPGFIEDRWITAAELQPGNRAVVHHILVFARPRGQEGGLGDGGGAGFLVGYVPGLRVRPLPSGMAKRIPAGSQLVFQVHYTPVGSPQSDQSRLGLIFAEPATVRHEVITQSAINPRFTIPPGAPNHRVEAYNRHPIPDSLLLSLMPHMHLRGKSFRYEAVYPDGSREVLLDVPRYDFNWQTSYQLAEPKRLPAGTRIHCVAHFDNSDDNPHNPDSSQSVQWGDQTWEEMMLGYFDLAVSRDASATAGRESARAVVRRGQQAAAGGERAEAVLRRLDTNGDGGIQRDELPERWRSLFDRLDDGDGQLSREELDAALQMLDRLR